MKAVGNMIALFKYMKDYFVKTGLDLLSVVPQNKKQIDLIYKEQLLLRYQEKVSYSKSCSAASAVGDCISPEIWSGNMTRRVNCTLL